MEECDLGGVTRRGLMLLILTAETIIAVTSLPLPRSAGKLWELQHEIEVRPEPLD